jgi:hypothetical protein
MRLSVLINTFDRPGALAGCLTALARENAAPPANSPDEVIVVDDGGTADLGAAVEPWRGRPGFRLIRIEHAGRAAARNAGVRAATGDRILFLGDDVIVRPGCVARHRMRSEPLIAVVGPYPWTSLAGSPPFRRWAEPNPQDRIADPENAGFQFFATGNLSMDRALFLELGGFDERFRVYGWEDIDLGLRFERAGGRLVFDREARAIHEHDSMTRAALWRREGEMGRTAWQFWRKWAAIDPALVEFMKFWDDPARIRTGPPWRRTLGDALIALLDRLAPASALTAKLYERMIFSHRLAGVAEAWKRDPISAISPVDDSAYTPSDERWVFIYITGELPCGRDVIEDALDNALKGHAEVTGGGMSLVDSNCNIDLAITDQEIESNEVLRIVRKVLIAHGVPRTTTIEMPGMQYRLYDSFVGPDVETR